MKKSIKDLTKGETLLYRVRKVYKNLSKPEEGFKPSLELCEFIDNGRSNAISELNDDDDRFNQPKAQRAYQPASLNVAIAEGWITAEQFEKLEHSAGISADEQKEGKHYVTVDILNPTLKGTRLRVQVIETTATTRKNADRSVKINPSNGKPVLSGGLPVYRFVGVAYEGNHASVFLPNDSSATIPTQKAVIASENING